MAVGLGGPTAVDVHLTTHAFFKALLFLVLAGHPRHAHTAGHLEDGRASARSARERSGRSSSRYARSLRGAAVQRFYSKDAILAQALHAHNYAALCRGRVVAVLTTFYMFRLFFVDWSARNGTKEAVHAHDRRAS